MNFLNPSVKLINEPDNFKRIERAGRMCYSPNMEILTENGWKNVSEVSEDEKVLTYNKERNSIQYETSNMIQKDYDGNIYKSNHSLINFEVTEDHRMFISHGYTRDYKFICAKDMLNSYHGKNTRWRFPLYFNNVSCNSEDYTETFRYSCSIEHGFRPATEDYWEFTINDDILVLIGAYIAEGFIIDGRSKGHGSCVTITQSDGPFLDRIIKSIENLGLRYNINADPRKPYIKHVHFGRFVHMYAINEMCSHYSRDVHLPVWFRKLSKRQMNLLLQILYLGDGSHNTKRSESYISSSKRLRDEVQELFVLTGRSASVHNTFVTERKRDSYIVLQNQIETYHYSGKVYCPSTDSGIVCVRYNGKPVWCGNCYKSEDKITEDSAFPFFQRIVNRGHTSVIEHSVLFVRTHTPEATMKLKQILDDYTEETGYPHYIRYSQWTNDSEVYDPVDSEYNSGFHLGSCVGKEYLFSGNFRAWRKLCEKFSGEPILYDTFHTHKALSDIFQKYQEENKYNSPWVYTQEQIEIVDSIPTDPHEFKDAYKHNIVTLHITADRGIIDEFVRHRACSFSVESTRYVSYKESGVSFVFPWWFTDMKDNPKYSSLAGSFGNRCYDTEVAYQDFLAKSGIPQLARGALTLWIKSEMAMTGTVQQWIDVLKLRDSAGAHPDAQKIAKMIEEVLVKEVGIEDIWGVNDSD